MKPVKVGPMLLSCASVLETHAHGHRHPRAFSNATQEHRLRREIKILRHLNGGPHIIRLIEVIRDPDTKTPCFVFDLVNATGLRELQAVVTDLDVRFYMGQLLKVSAMLKVTMTMQIEVIMRHVQWPPVPFSWEPIWAECITHVKVPTSEKIKLIMRHAQWSPVPLSWDTSNHKGKYQLGGLIHTTI